jgi:hypothetical protein
MQRIATKANKKVMLDALEKTLGIVTTAAKLAGIDRVTHYRWYESDPAYREKVDLIPDMVLDFAESQLHQQIKDKDTAATIFFLKCKGKHRGYIEKTEFGFTKKDGSDLFNFTPLPDTQPLEIKEND